MAKISSSVQLGLITFDPDSSSPRYRQLYDNLRQAILSGRLARGTRLQSTRELAKELNVSRNTVVHAFEQLLAEGYLEGQVGSGTYVSLSLPEELLYVRSASPRIKDFGRRARGLSQRGKLLAVTKSNVPRETGPAKAFRTGVPDLESFPFDIWWKIMARHWRHPAKELLGYGESQGYLPLRKAIATYLGAARGVRCVPEQIVITSAQMALNLTTRVLLDPGDSAWVEDPGYLGARGAIAAAGVQLVHVPVDQEGIDVEAGASLAPGARLIYVTPSHQYPSGVTMSLARRLALLDWAGRAGAWVMEDDYDSEFRYEGRPLAALQGLDNDGRVIYIGTFSKVMFPSMRLGYLVVPSDLVSAFTSARSLIDRHSPTLEQAVLADFIAEGHFGRHIRRMRAFYAERQKLLLDLLRREAGSLLDVKPSVAGLHLVAWLPDGVDDREVSREAAARGVEAQPLSVYSFTKQERGAVVLGYAAYGERELHQAVLALVSAIKFCLSKVQRNLMMRLG